jgi:hypothetical protein
MVKKIITGGTFTNNNNWFLYLIIFSLIIYILFLLNYNIYQKEKDSGCNTTIYNNERQHHSFLDRFSNPYVPPLQTNSVYNTSSRDLDLRGTREKTGGDSRMIFSSFPERSEGQTIHIPVNIPTQGRTLEYTQIGILTKVGIDENQPLILPLMGRQNYNNRNKYQYYTISNTGSNNTKLPVKINGKSCTSAMGCNEVSASDEVFVEGYKSKFIPTIYENITFDYIPY